MRRRSVREKQTCDVRVPETLDCRQKKEISRLRLAPPLEMTRAWQKSYGSYGGKEPWNDRLYIIYANKSSIVIFTGMSSA